MQMSRFEQVGLAASIFIQAGAPPLFLSTFNSPLRALHPLEAPSQTSLEIIYSSLGTRVLHRQLCCIRQLGLSALLPLQEAPSLPHHKFHTATRTRLCASLSCARIAVSVEQDAGARVSLGRLRCGAAANLALIALAGLDTAGKVGVYQEFSRCWARRREIPRAGNGEATYQIQCDDDAV